MWAYLWNHDSAHNRKVVVKFTGDVSGGPVVKNLPFNAGDAGLIPSWGTKIPYTSDQLSPLATITEPVHSYCSARRSGVPRWRLTQPKSNKKFKNGWSSPNQRKRCLVLRKHRNEGSSRDLSGRTHEPSAEDTAIQMIHVQSPSFPVSFSLWSQSQERGRFV